MNMNLRILTQLTLLITLLIFMPTNAASDRGFTNITECCAFAELTHGVLVSDGAYEAMEVILNGSDAQQNQDLKSLFRYLKNSATRLITTDSLPNIIKQLKTMTQSSFHLRKRCTCCTAVGESHTEQKRIFVGAVMNLCRALDSLNERKELIGEIEREIINDTLSVILYSTHMSKENCCVETFCEYCCPLDREINSAYWTEERFHDECAFGWACFWKRVVPCCCCLTTSAVAVVIPMMLYKSKTLSSSEAIGIGVGGILTATPTLTGGMITLAKECCTNETRLEYYCRRLDKLVSPAATEIRRTPHSASSRPARRYSSSRSSSDHSYTAR